MKTLATPWPARALVLSGAAASDVFTPAELARAAELTLQKRRDEWLLSRAAAKTLAVQLGLAADERSVTIERPRLLVEGRDTGWHVSLSHSTPYAAAAIAREPVGIDVQVIRDLDLRAAHLFLTSEEERAMQRCTIAHRMLHFWCAKEAAFKQRSDEFTTMRQLHIELLEEREAGLLFDVVETVAIDDVIVALTRPVSS
ncbi:MAG TPA: 4'-phosphopantetheinyl transferase superfamily protein [Thermoanaerobaculia bacterium]|nr:4'-phosphopantetheinyl transferase superfamily protein [Thermoanaerobaculia bacterium]